MVAGPFGEPITERTATRRGERITYRPADDGDKNRHGREHRQPPAPPPGPSAPEPAPLAAVTAWRRAAANDALQGEP